MHRHDQCGCVCLAGSGSGGGVELQCSNRGDPSILLTAIGRSFSNPEWCVLCVFTGRFEKSVPRLQIQAVRFARQKNPRHPPPIDGMQPSSTDPQRSIDQPPANRTASQSILTLLSPICYMMCAGETGDRQNHESRQTRCILPDPQICLERLVPQRSQPTARFPILTSCFACCSVLCVFFLCLA